MISIFVSHRMLIGWHSTDKPTVVHREDRANTPVFNRLDISSARIKTQIPVFLTLQGHEVPQNQRKRTAFFLGSDLTSRTEVTPNQTVLKSATSWSIMDCNHLPYRRPSKRMQKPRNSVDGNIPVLSKPVISTAWFALPLEQWYCMIPPR